MSKNKNFLSLVAVFSVLFIGVILFKFKADSLNLASVFSSPFGQSSISGNKIAKPATGIYVFGGDDNINVNNNYFNDGYFSGNGTTWGQLSASALWTPRSNLGALYFKNMLWIIGGDSGGQGLAKNDIYNSIDGKQWNTIIPNSAIFTPRASPMVTVFKGEMYVMGGWDSSIGGVTNQVWKSADGISWKPVVPLTSIWSPRYMSATANLNSQMFVIGGFGGGTTIWKTSDGQSWVEVDTDPSTPGKQPGPWSPRYGHTVTAFDYDGLGKKLVLIGGLYGNDIWTSNTSGNLWTHFDTNPSTPAIDDGPWVNGITGHQTFVYKNKLWVLGGKEWVSGAPDPNNMSNLWSTTDLIHWQIESNKPLGPNNPYRSSMGVIVSP
jgi:hypothetical protein